MPSGVKPALDTKPGPPGCCNLVAFFVYYFMSSFSRHKKILQQHGLKVTSARLQVLDTLLCSEVALSHADILSRIPQARLDKVTLYRTLYAFVESGLAHKVATEDRNWLYALQMTERADTVIGDHAHFICDHCERIYCLPVASGCDMPNPRAEDGFVFRSHEFRFHGTCPQCH